MTQQKSVAEQTYEWLISTGRLSGEGELRVKEVGLDAFLKACTEIWEEQGSSRFMQGMKDVMFAQLWAEETSDED